MSRSGYGDEYGWETIMWRGQVASATRGKRGQRMFSDLKAALEAMPNKRLIKDALVLEGEVCALGALGEVRGVDMKGIDPENTRAVGAAFDIAHQLAAEVVWENDEGGHWQQTPQQRWSRMHKWVCAQIRSRA